MALLNQAFDATTIDPTQTFEVLPAGDYPVMVVDSDMKSTKDGSGQYLQLTLEVIDGPYSGRVIFDRLNLVNRNDKAVEIAQRTLSQICHAIGVLRVQDSAELHNKPILAKVAYKPASGQYGESNEVKGYKAYAAAAAPAARAAPAYIAPVSAPQPAQQPAAPASASVPPWAAR